MRKTDLARVTGIHPRRLLDWTQKGYLVPAEKVEGQGKASFYSPANAVQAKALEALSETGMSLGKFSKNFPELSPEQLDPYSANPKDRIEIIIKIDLKNIMQNIRERIDDAIDGG